MAKCLECGNEIIRSKADGGKATFWDCRHCTQIYKLIIESQPAPSMHEKSDAIADSPIMCGYELPADDGGEIPTDPIIDLDKAA